MRSNVGAMMKYKKETDERLMVDFGSIFVERGVLRDGRVLLDRCGGIAQIKYDDPVEVVR